MLRCGGIPAPSSIGWIWGWSLDERGEWSCVVGFTLVLDNHIYIQIGLSVANTSRKFLILPHLKIAFHI
jgi:hypothetical protein